MTWHEMITVKDMKRRYKQEWRKKTEREMERGKRKNDNYQSINFHSTY